MILGEGRNAEFLEQVCEWDSFGETGKGGAREDLESQGGYPVQGKGPYGGDLGRGKVKRKAGLSLQVGNAGRVCSMRGSRRDEGGNLWVGPEGSL